MALFSKKRSVFDRISGASSIDDAEFDDEPLPVRETARSAAPAPAATARRDAGELPVDVYQTPSEIVIRAFVAGVRPDELAISISRDLVSIEGERMERENVAAGDTFTRELFWGAFARTISLPVEVDVDNSAASAKDGLLTIILPKLDKARQTRLRVKAS
jgi:HSP20 family molecular chaperone IbpA